METMILIVLLIMFVPRIMMVSLIMVMIVIHHFPLMIIQIGCR